jgi:hypothetical protein
VCAIFCLWQRSSVAEQGTHKPLVAGSNPAAATLFWLGVIENGCIGQLMTFY